MPTNNNLQSVRSFVPQYKALLLAVFQAKNAFTDALTPMQSLDGVSYNAKAFTVKTTGAPVVIGTYNTDANVGFGTGTGSSSRFGARNEVIYADTDVDYSYNLAIHEGIDNFTINADFNQAVADRLDLQAQAQTRYMNKLLGAHLSANAGSSLALAAYTDTDIQALFNAASKAMTNAEVTADLTAYLAPDVYNAVIDLASTTTFKGSTINLDNNALIKYKGFKLKETSEQYFATGDVAYFVADGTVLPFVGIQTARTIDSEDFDGKALQAAAKGGFFTLDDNKKAIIKVTGADNAATPIPQA